MIYLLLYWIYISVFLLILGDLAESALYRLVREKPFVHFFFRKIVAGIAGLMVITGLAHFFIPIDELMHLLILIVLLSCTVIRLKTYRALFHKLWSKIADQPLVITFVCLVVIFMMGYIATDQPFYNLDEGRYHLQALLWAKEYPVVPGLANLHARLASNSCWYTFNAFFDVFFFERKVYHVINPLLMIYLLLYCITQIKNIFSGTVSAIAAFFLLLYILVQFNFFRYWYLIGVTPDWAVQFFILVLTLYIVRIMDKQSMENDGRRFHMAFVVILCGSAFISRVSGTIAFLFLLPVFFFLRNRSMLTWKSAFFYVFLFLPFLLIFLARNSILSGYPFFPYELADVLSVDWKFPADCLRKAADSFSNHQLKWFLQRDVHYDHAFSFERLQDLFKMFIQQSVLKLNIFSVNILSLLLLLGTAFTRRRLLPLQITFAVLFVLFFILSGGVYRFGAGLYAVTAVVPLALSFGPELIRLLFGIRWSVYLLIMVLSGLFFIIPSIPVSLKESAILYPVEVAKEVKRSFFSLPSVPASDYTTHRVGNLSLNIPVYAKYNRARLGTWFSYKDEDCPVPDPVLLFCHSCLPCEAQIAFESKMNWMNPLPSVGSGYIGIEKRGHSLKEGFRLNKADPGFLKFAADSL